MTSGEFHEWLKHHKASFPRFGTWLAAPAKELHDPTPGKKLERCYEALAAVSLDDAIRATDTFYSGSEQFTDQYSCGSHAVDVARVAKMADAQPKRHDEVLEGRERYKCQHCRDRGMLHVYGSKFVRWFARQQPYPVVRHESGLVTFDASDSRWLEAKKEKALRYSILGVSVNCVCAPEFDRKFTRGRMLRFDPKRMVPFAEWCDVSNLIAFCDANPTGRNDEWDPDFSSSPDAWVNR